MKKKNSNDFNVDKIDKALKKGIREAMIRHKKLGEPIVVWKNGKVVILKAEEIEIPYGDDFK